MSDQLKISSELIASDPAVAYAVTKYQMAESLPEGPSPYQSLSSFEMIDLIRNGLTKKSIYNLASLMSLTLEQICELIHISPRTLQRKSDLESLGSFISERILDITDLVVHGICALGSTDAFQSWLVTNRPALGGVKPLDLLDTSLGCQLVGDILGRIEHGVIS